MHLAERVQVRAAVRVHDALRAAGGARGVVDRDDALLVVDRRRERQHRRAGDELRVARPVERRPTTPATGSSTFTNSGARARAPGAPATRGASSGSTSTSFAPGVVEDVADLLGLEPRVDRDQRARARASTAKCATSSAGTFGASTATRSPGAMPARTQRAGEAADLVGELGVAPAQRRRRRPRSCPGTRAACARAARAASADRSEPAARPGRASRRFYTRFQSAEHRMCERTVATVTTGTADDGARCHARSRVTRSRRSRARLAPVRRGLDGPDPDPVRVVLGGSRAACFCARSGVGLRPRCAPGGTGLCAAAQAPREDPTCCSARAAPSLRARRNRACNRHPGSGCERELNPEAATASALPGRWRWDWRPSSPRRKWSKTVWR